MFKFYMAFLPLISPDHLSSQIIATSHDLTSKGKSPYFRKSRLVKFYNLASYSSPLIHLDPIWMVQPGNLFTSKKKVPLMACHDIPFYSGHGLGNSQGDHSVVFQFWRQTGRPVPSESGSHFVSGFGIYFYWPPFLPATTSSFLAFF